MPDFLDGFDRLVAFDAETTGKRTPDAEFIRKQPFAWRAPGIIIEVRFVEMLREGEGWRKGEIVPAMRLKQASTEPQRNVAMGGERKVMLAPSGARFHRTPIQTVLLSLATRRGSVEVHGIVGLGLESIADPGLGQQKIGTLRVALNPASQAKDGHA